MLRQQGRPMHQTHNRRKTAIAAAVALFMLAFIATSCKQEEGNFLYVPLPRYEKHPYLIYGGDNTMMTVRWQLTETADSHIEWGTADGVYDLGSITTTENSPDRDQHIHQHTITGLTPGTRYYYRVTTIGGTRTGSFFAAPAAAATALKFVAYGDSRTYRGTHDRLAGGILELYDADPAYRTLLLSMGDLVSSGGLEIDWTREFFSPSMTNLRTIMLSVPFIATVGNHDLSLGGTVLFKKYFPYPYASVAGRYWSFDFGPAHFAIVDGYTDFSAGSAQRTWLGNDLSATTKTWKFVLIHQPGWSAGGGHLNNTNIQDSIEPLCETYGVDVLFAGHNHYYARAEVPYGAGKKVYHVTTGGGGAPLHFPQEGRTNVVTISRSYHYCAVEIAGNTLTLRAIDIDANEIDSFSITK